MDCLCQQQDALKYSSICPELTLDIQYMTDCKSKAESSNQNTST